MSDYPKMYAGAMRLARKYDAQKIIDTFASGLRQIFPRKIEQVVLVWTCFKQSATPLHDAEADGLAYERVLSVADVRIDAVFPDAG